MHVLVEIDALDRATGNRVTLRACSGELPELCGWGDRVWAPAIKDPGELALKLFDGGFGSAPDVGGASFSISDSALELVHPQAPSLRFQGAPLRLWAGLTPGTIAPDPLFVAKVVKFESTNRLTKVSADVNTETLTANVLTAEYAGTTGLEGGADLKGRVKPWTLGRCLNIEPVLLDAVENVYQVSAYGRIGAVTGVFDKGITLGPSLGDYDLSTDLFASTLPEGRWATCLAQGLIKVGAPAYGVLTCDVDGDSAGGVFPRMTGAIVRRVAAGAGVPLDRLDTASLDASDALAATLPGGGTIGVHLSSQTTFLDFARRMFLPLNTVVAVSWTGKMFATRIATDSPALTLEAQGRQLPEVFDMAEGDTLPPYKRITMGARRVWSVQALDDLSFYAPLVERGRYDPAETYREGHIVDLADGSRWLFVAELPAAGQPPAVGSIYWQNLSGPVEASLGDVTLDDIPDGTSYKRATPAELAAITDAQQKADAASASANSASTTANSAISRLNTIDDDGIIDRDEKVTILIPDSAALEGAYNAIVASADALGVDRTAAINARATWINLRDSLVPPWNDITQNTPFPTGVSRGSWDAALLSYRNALEQVRKAIEAKAATLAQWGSVTGAGKPQDNATYGALPSEAATLSAVNTALAAINDDGILTTSEKRALIPAVQSVQKRWEAALPTANAWGIDYTGAANAVGALNSTLAGITPTWDNVTVNSPANGATIRSQLINAQGLVADLDKRLKEEAARRALWSKTENDNGLRPENGATVGASVTQAADIAAAKSALAAIANDNILAASEKIELINRKSELDNRVRAARDASVALVVPGVIDPTLPQRQAVEVAKSDLDNYLTNRSPPWNQLGVDTPITGSQLRLLFDTVYDKLSTLEQANVTVAGQYAEWSKTYGPEKPENFATYGSTAEEAAKISASKASLDAITNDNILAKSQKSLFLGLVNDVLNRVVAVRTASVNLVIPNVLDATNAERAAVEASLATFNNYHNSLSPPFNDLSTDTPIDGPYDRSLFADLYLKCADLDAANVTEAAKQGLWGVRVRGTGRPADYADVTVNQPIVSRINPNTGRISDPRMLNTSLLVGQRESTSLSPTYTVEGSSIRVSLGSHTLYITGPGGPVGLSYGGGSFLYPPSSFWYAYLDDPDLIGSPAPAFIVSGVAIDGQYPGRRRVAFGVTPALDGSGGSTGTGGGGTPRTPDGNPFP